MEQLKFTPLSSSADAGFWHALSSRKLDEFKLDDSHRAITGYYAAGWRPDMPPRISIGSEAFDMPAAIPAQAVPAPGLLAITNTLEEFKTFDVAAFADRAVQQLWDDMTSGRALEDPACLARFALLTFADLKKYKFYYWFSFPAVRAATDATATASVPATDHFSEEQLRAVHAGAETLDGRPGFFLARKTAASDDAGGVEVLPLAKAKEVFAAPEATSQCFAAFVDPGADPTHPGWLLRNYLALLALALPHVKTVKVLCFRYTVQGGVCDVSPSRVIEVTLAPVEAGPQPPRAVRGWEKNKKQNPGPRLCDLSSSMDPVRLAETAVGLNLKLMRWRLMPSIDLPKIAATKCLLLGSGTLGCNVARLLLGWGVRTITMLDNSTVSFSNPVRQSLFTFSDCLEGGRPKAQAAVEQLKAIFPGVDAKAVSLTVPMPGHPVAGAGPIAEAKKSAAELDALIAEHDAVFLLMDTREARWLPSVLCAVHEKPCFTAAIGFDTFVAMRHGLTKPQKAADAASAAAEAGPAAAGPARPSDRSVGCYFCNDVVAPANSTRDRTLDQQCTVSRPGTSMLVSANVVELMVAMLHHPLGGAASTSAEADGCAEPALGAVPHQIRGNLGTFEQSLFSGQAFDKCTACSKTVTEAYRRDGFDFLMQAFNSPTFLEDLTGLTAMRQQVDADLEDLDWADEDLEDSEFED